MYFIISKAMPKEIRNEDIYQYFGDATYRYVPPTFRALPLYVLSGFNLIIKKTTALAFILLQMSIYNL